MRGEGGVSGAVRGFVDYKGNYSSAMNWID